MKNERLNRNIGCIEINPWTRKKKLKSKLNRNIGCIEIPGKN